MVTLPALAPNGNGTGPRNWTSQDYTAIDEPWASFNDADFIQAAAGTTNNDTSFTLTDTPSDFGNMDTLLWRLRYAQTGRSDDTLGLSFRVMASDGTTVLAAATSGGTFQSVSTNVTNTAFATGGLPTAFSYVNTTATKAQWDGAELQIRQIYSQSMGADNASVRVSAFELTGTYTASAGGTQFNRSVSDGSGISDARSQVASLTRSPADGSGIADSRTQTTSTARTSQDAAGTSDTMAFVRALSRETADSAGFADVLARVATLARAQSSGAGVADAMSYDHQASGGQVAFDARYPDSNGESVGDTTAVNYIEWSHTCSGSNRIVFVVAGYGPESSDAGDTLSATYGGTAMTSVAIKHTNNQTAGFVQMWYLINPPTGAQTVRVTCSETAANINSLHGASVSFTGVHQTAPIGTPVTAAEYTGQTPQVTVNSATTGAMLISVGGSGSTISSGNQTTQYIANVNGNTGCGNSIGQTAAGGGGNTTFTFSHTTDFWAYIAVEIKPTSGSGTQHNRSVADTAGSADVLARAATYTRSQATSSPLAEILAQASTLTRSATETIGISDSLSATVLVSSLLSEAAGLLDALSRFAAQQRTASDLAGYADSLARNLQAIRVHASSVGIADASSHTLQVITNRAMADLGGVSDVLSSAAQILRTPTENAGYADSIGYQASGNIARSIANLAGIADALSQVAASSRVFLDQVGLGEFTARSQTHGRSHNEAAGTSDSIARTHNAVRAAVEFAGQTDAIAYSAAGVVARNIVDTAGFQDLIIRTLTYQREVAEPAGYADALQRGSDIARAIIDPSGATDDLRRSATYVVKLLDDAEISDLMQQFTRVFAALQPNASILVLVDAISELGRKDVISELNGAEGGTSSLD